MLARRTLIAPAAAITAVVALGLGLLPTGATAAPAPSVDAAFTPTLTYVPCPAGEELPPRTRCASLRVPLDWQTPDDGRTIQIAMRVTTPRRDAGRMGLTWNPGGPGATVIDSHRGVYSRLPASVRNRFDFVSWDPRGVGQSGPKLAECTPVSVLPPATGPVDWDAFWEEVDASEGAALAACFAANPNAAPYLGTWQVVRDMDAMRAALGYDRWNYWGISYGTRIGNTYARTFPDRLRALIEDAPIMANENLARFGSTSPAGFFEAEQVYASLVGKRQAYKIRAIFDYLDDSTIDLGPRGILTRWGFSGTVNGLLREEKFTNLRAFINALYDFITADAPETRERAARAAARVLQHRSVDEPIIPDPLSDSFLRSFVNCADLPDRPTPAQIARMSRVAEQDYGTAYGFNVNRASDCLGLPSGYSPPTSNGDSTIALPIPPLFLLTTGDAATPWIWGRSLANTFARSRTITYDSTMHGVIVITSPCLEGAIEKYLLNLQPPRGDVFCPFGS
jgi:pimeloyl-ACP methyl ester carboxylesterase